MTCYMYNKNFNWKLIFDTISYVLAIINVKSKISKQVEEKKCYDFKRYAFEI